MAQNGENMNRWTKAAIGVGVVVVGMQLVRFEHTNPPVTAEVDAPLEVKALLARACYDCHSNKTEWPWYTNIAPISWLVHRDVTEGRRELNFSTFAALTPEKRAKKLDDVVDEVQDDDMPPWFYLPLHPHAKLSADEKKTLLAWAHAGSAEPETKEKE